MEPSTIILVSALANIIILIVFFVLASKVSAIKSEIAPSHDELFEQYKKLRYFKEYHKATSVLNEIIWKQTGGHLKGANYENMKKEYEPYYQAVGGEFPAERDF